MIIIIIIIIVIAKMMMIIACLALHRTILFEGLVAIHDDTPPGRMMMGQGVSWGLSKPWIPNCGPMRKSLNP